MNGNLLLDTNILIEIIKGNSFVIDLISDNNCYISSITAIEILSNRKSTKSELKSINSLLNEFKLLSDINKDVINLASDFRRNNQIKKTPDAIIGATAKINNLILITRDKDFEFIKEIQKIILE